MDTLTLAAILDFLIDYYYNLLHPLYLGVESHVTARCQGLFPPSHNLVPRACDPWEGNEGSGIIRCRKPGILAKIELRIHFNGQSDSSLKRIIPEPSFPSQGSQARGTRLAFPMTKREKPWERGCAGARKLYVVSRNIRWLN